MPFGEKFILSPRKPTNAAKEFYTTGQGTLKNNRKENYGEKENISIECAVKKREDGCLLLIRTISKKKKKKLREISSPEFKCPALPKELL
jgi:hypothetical protein